MAEGIEKRTSRGYPVYRAVVYDRRTGRKVSRTFPTLAEARSWRTRMQELSRRGFSLAGTPELVPSVPEDAGCFHQRSPGRCPPVALWSRDGRPD